MIYFLALIPAAAAFFGVSYVLHGKTSIDPGKGLAFSIGAALAAYGLTLIMF